MKCIAPIRLRVQLGFVIACCAVPVIVLAQQAPTSLPLDTRKPATASVRSEIGISNFMFEPAADHGINTADFLDHEGRCTVFLHPTEFSVSITEPSESESGQVGSVSQTLAVRLLGSHLDAKPHPTERLETKINDYNGSERKSWRLQVPTYARVDYAHIYDGVDVSYHGSTRELEYDFTISPGTDPGVVRLLFEGAERLTVNGKGELLITLPDGATIIQHKPVAYQDGPNGRTPVEVAYEREQANTFGFHLGAYDVSKPLIIDPVVYSIFFGQSDADAGRHIVLDASGNAYVAGQMNSGATPPNVDAIVDKYGPTGVRLWRDVFHGNGKKDGIDIANGVALDPTGNFVFVTGTTTSDDFPVVGGFSGTCGGTGSTGCNGKKDAFLVKVDSATGSTTL